jgi:hypothetical protein
MIIVHTNNIIAENRHMRELRFPTAAEK